MLQNISALLFTLKLVKRSEFLCSDIQKRSLKITAIRIKTNKI